MLILRSLGPVRRIERGFLFCFVELDIMVFG